MLTRCLFTALISTALACAWMAVGVGVQFRASLHMVGVGEREIFCSTVVGAVFVLPALLTVLRNMVQMWIAKAAKKEKSLDARAGVLRAQRVAIQGNKVSNRTLYAYRGHGRLGVRSDFNWHLAGLAISRDGKAIVDELGLRSLDRDGVSVRGTLVWRRRVVDFGIDPLDFT